MIILDTNIIIEVFKGNPEIITTVQAAGTINIALSSITAMELYYGAISLVIPEYAVMNGV